MRNGFTGDPVEAEDDLPGYTGRAAADHIVGELRRRAFLYNHEQLALNYGDNVEFLLRQEQVILCPQTTDWLYSRFTPPEVGYRRGSRPVLERVVAEATAGAGSDQARVLALMRFCRDNYLRTGDGMPSNDLFGGTEEQLIDKGENLCECLGRLLVALCEVAGIPGRIVMHNVGGHIAAEAWTEGKWGYVDPRCGVYFLKADGTLASVQELLEHPAIIDQQPADVKADVSRQWSWEERAGKCKRMYFTPEEVTGFQNYSLAYAGRYRYAQVRHAEATAAGLLRINAVYRATLNTVFGTDADPYFLPPGQPKHLPIAYRHDGFSYFFSKPPMDRARVEREMIDPLRDTNATIMVWGVGPGSVFCFDTKVGEVFGAPLTAQQWGLMRDGDRWVYENVTG